jgi:hypothetical protein
VDGEGQGRIVLPFEGANVLLAEFQGNVWQATCPSVMGQHFADVLRHVRTRFPKDYPVLIVDVSEALDCTKVSAGAAAAAHFFTSTSAMSGPASIASVCWFDERGTAAEIRYHRESAI